MGTKQLLMSRPDLIGNHLRTLVPAVARLISDCGHDPALSGHLRSLLRVICSVPSHAMAAHFALFVAHLLHALTHNELGVRNFALSVIGLLLTTYPKLCSSSADLFTAFVKFLGSSRRPAWNFPRFLEIIEAFIKAYVVDKTNLGHSCEAVQLNMSNGEISSKIDIVKIFLEMVTKKKAKKNADFKKVKLKVGKKLKKTTTTDTTITTKKVVLISQLQVKNVTSDKPLSYRGLSLEELCKQLGHFNK
ncbi:hypothetical protein OSTOST_16090, partial [Ostertagia ostertagi]